MQPSEELNIDTIEDLMNANMIVIELPKNVTFICGELRNSTIKKLAIFKIDKNDDKSKNIRESYQFYQNGPYAPIQTESMMKLQQISSFSVKDSIPTLYGNYFMPLDKSFFISPINSENNQVESSISTTGTLYPGTKWPKKGLAVIRGKSRENEIQGKLELTQESPDQPVHIYGTVIGLNPGMHGFTIYDYHGQVPGEEHLAIVNLGNIFVASNHASLVDLIDNSISLEDPSSVFGRIIVIQTDEIDDLPRNAEKMIAAFGAIQSENEFNEVISAKAMIHEPENGLTAMFDLVQEGRKNFVLVKGSVVGLESGRYGLMISNNCEIPIEDEIKSESLTEFDVKNQDIPIGCITSAATFIDDYFGVFNFTEFSPIGNHVVLFKKGLHYNTIIDAENIKCGKIWRTADRINPRCYAPAKKSDHRICGPKFGLAWTYDPKRHQCIIDYLEDDCPHHTASNKVLVNKFETEKECQMTCSFTENNSAIKISLVPTLQVLTEFINNHSTWTAAQTQKLLLCHTIITNEFSYDSPDPEYESLCGQILKFNRNEFSLEINDYHVEEYFMTKKEDNGGYTNNVNVVLVVPAIFGFDP